MDQYATSHSIIKALKSPSEAPDAQGLSKIDIANLAWHNSQIFFPSKNEVLVDWILNSLLKVKGSDAMLRPLYDLRYWTLLYKILSEDTMRSNKLWVSTVLSRMNISAIISEFLSEPPDSEEVERLSIEFSRCMLVLWPLAVGRLNVDILIECFGAIISLSVYSREYGEHNVLNSICSTIIRSFRQTLGSSSNRKRVYTLFTEKYFRSWLQVLAHVNGLNHSSAEHGGKDLNTEIIQAGIDVLFSVDVLKGSQDPFNTIISSAMTQAQGEVDKLRSIPLLFQAYVQEVHKHRHAIFSAGSKAAHDQTVDMKAKKASLDAFAIAYQVLCHQRPGIETFQSLVNLLKTVDEANLVSHSAEKDLGIFSKIAGDIVASFSGAYEDSIFVSSVQVLTILTRIDHDIVSPFMKDIFQILLTLDSNKFPAAQTLLHEILEFHSKTRTISAFLSTITQSLSADYILEFFKAKRASLQELYQKCLSSSLLDRLHLEELGRAGRTYLTPGQTFDTVNNSLRCLQDAHDKFFFRQENTDTMGYEELTNLLEGNDQANRSNRKERNTDDTSRNPPNLAALSFALNARIVAVVLPSLPFSTISESVRSTLLPEIEGRYALFSDAAVSILGSDNPSWTEQIIAAATLHIGHALYTCPTLRSLDILRHDVVSSQRIGTLMNLPQTIPDLSVEMLRLYFDHLSHNPDQDRRLIRVDTIVRYLSSRLGFEEQTEDEPILWDGSLAQLSTDMQLAHHRSAQVVWNLLLERWLPLLEESAPDEDLEDIARLFFQHGEVSSFSQKSSRSPLSFEWSLERAIRSAQIWELARFRGAMIFVINETIELGNWSELDMLLDEALFPSREADALWDTDFIGQVTSIFEVLSWAPPEYLPRASKATLVYRAIIADLMICNCGAQPAANKAVCAYAIMTIRKWLSLAFASGLQDLLPPQKINYVLYLGNLLVASRSTPMSASYEDATLELITALQKNIVRQAVKNEDDQLERLCEVLAEFYEGGHWCSKIVRLSIVVLLDTLVNECPQPEKLTQGCIGVLERLYELLSDYCSFAAGDLLLGRITETDGPILRLTTTRLTLKKWLRNEDKSKEYGRPLLLMVLKNDKLKKSVGADVFVILSKELPFKAPETRTDNLFFIVSSYILISTNAEEEQLRICDTALISFLKSLSLDDYIYIMSLLRDAMSNEAYSWSELTTVVRLNSLLISNAPEGSLKRTQEHFEECLSIFLCSAEWYLTGDTMLNWEVLKFIAGVCSEKPASLRLLALGPIWSILSKILSESRVHTEESHLPTLHTIINIIGALIRLRRDLVQSTLPHLGQVLRSLLRTLPSIRPHLGARQRVLVADTFPYWLAPGSASAGLEEARAVARLLTTLTNKTVPRTFNSSSKRVAYGGGDAVERRAESLAGAFSKHAAPVLAAYITMLSDPLLVINSTVRDALAPGLFALCEMMGEHARDALMASGLDGTGRAALKMLWGEYEKQRYVGKG